jgi:hypothetical protein
METRAQLVAQNNHTTSGLFFSDSILWKLPRLKVKGYIIYTLVDKMVSKCVKTRFSQSAKTHIDLDQEIQRMIILKLITRNIRVSPSHDSRLRPIVLDIGGARRHPLKFFCGDKRESKSSSERLW